MNNNLPVLNTRLTRDKAEALDLTDLLEEKHWFYDNDEESFSQYIDSFIQADCNSVNMSIGDRNYVLFTYLYQPEEMCDWNRLCLQKTKYKLLINMLRQGYTMEIYMLDEEEEDMYKLKIYLYNRRFEIQFYIK